jgi:hypothetical protein
LSCRSALRLTGSARRGSLIIEWRWLEIFNAPNLVCGTVVTVHSLDGWRWYSDKQQAIRDQREREKFWRQSRRSLKKSSTFMDRAAAFESSQNKLNGSPDKKPESLANSGTLVGTIVDAVALMAAALGAQLAKAQRQLCRYPQGKPHTHRPAEPCALCERHAKKVGARTSLASDLTG